MKSRQPTGSTVRPDTEGQAFEETMNKAVRYQGTAFRSIQAILSDVIKGFMLQQSTMQADRSFRRCLIGGTFDRFHSGHQLLIQTALRQADFIEVHVVNDEMAQAKGDWIQSLDDRMETLLDWLSDTAHLRYEIHVLSTIRMDLHPLTGLLIALLRRLKRYLDATKSMNEGTKTGFHHSQFLRLLT